MQIRAASRGLRRSEEATKKPVGEFIIGFRLPRIYFVVEINNANRNHQRVPESQARGTFAHQKLSPDHKMRSSSNWTQMPRHDNNEWMQNRTKKAYEIIVSSLLCSVSVRRWEQCKSISFRVHEPMCGRQREFEEIVCEEMNGASGRRARRAVKSLMAMNGIEKRFLVGAARMRVQFIACPAIDWQRLLHFARGTGCRTDYWNCIFE